MCIRDRLWDVNVPAEKLRFGLKRDQAKAEVHLGADNRIKACLLYTSDAADDLLCVDLGGRRIIKKKNKTNHSHQHKNTTTPDNT